MTDNVRPTAPPGWETEPATPRPEIILDFDFDDGVLFISLRNIGARPAHDVRTELTPPIRGLGGRQQMSGLQVFRGIAFFPAGKQIRFLLDSAAAYFGRGEPVRIAAHIKYSDDHGKNFDTVIQHDLEIYRSLPYRIMR
ncbi:MAG TPA: hypothetical protein VKE93_07275 [Candidatus Angelobacter sp.]|nr:hypothetical protein [Candidatus Angelobacter sp.]